MHDDFNGLCFKRRISCVKCQETYAALSVISITFSPPRYHHSFRYHKMRASFSGIISSYQSQQALWTPLNPQNAEMSSQLIHDSNANHVDKVTALERPKGGIHHYWKCQPDRSFGQERPIYLCRPLQKPRLEPIVIGWQPLPQRLVLRERISPERAEVASPHRTSPKPSPGTPRARPSLILPACETAKASSIASTDSDIVVPGDLTLLQIGTGYVWVLLALLANVEGTTCIAVLVLGSDVLSGRDWATWSKTTSWRIRHRECRTSGYGNCLDSLRWDRGLSAGLCWGPGLSAGLCWGPGLSAGLCWGPGLSAGLCWGPGLSACLCWCRGLSNWGRLISDREGLKGARKIVGTRLAGHFRRRECGTLPTPEAKAHL